MQFTKEGRKIQVSTRYGDPIVAKLKSENFKWNAQAKVWEKGYTKALWAWLEGLQAEKQEFAQTMQERKESGFVLSHSKSYDCRQQIKDLGGIWDKIKKVWVMPSSEALQQAIAICNEKEQAAQPKESQPKFLAPEYSNYQVGQVFKLDGQWCKVSDVRHSYDEDGSWVTYRPCTDEEVQSIEANLAKKEAVKELEAIAEEVMQPENLPEQAQITAPIKEVSHRLSVSVEESVIWICRYNGGDGDDWRGNNYRGYRAYIAPDHLHSKIQALLEKI